MASRKEIKETDEALAEDGDEEERSLSKGRAAGGRTRFQSLKAWFRDSRWILYLLFFTGSLILFALGTASVFAPSVLGAAVADWFRGIGSYNTYLFLLGFIALASSGYLYGALISKRTQFHRLVSTKSKSDFVRSLDKVERLAFELGSEESEIVAKKKREFRIRH